MVCTLHCQYFENSKSGQDVSGLKVKGVIHFVEANQAIDAEVRMYDRLLTDESPDAHEDKDFKEFINPNSLEVLKNCKLEPSLNSFISGISFKISLIPTQKSEFWELE